jgi:hypothetical protein
MCYDSPVDMELIKWNLERAVKFLPKINYQIVEILGDYYYVEKSQEETYSKGMIFNEDPSTMLRTQDEIC